MRMKDEIIFYYVIHLEMIKKIFAVISINSNVFRDLNQSYHYFILSVNL